MQFIEYRDTNGYICERVDGDMVKPEYVFCPKTCGMVSIDTHCDAGCNNLVIRERLGIKCTAQGPTRYEQDYMNETRRQAQERLIKWRLYNDNKDFKERFLKELRK